MTTYDDNLLASRFAALAPEPLPGDWGDVLGRVDVARGRRRLTRPRVARRRRLLVMFAVVALVAVVTASALAVRAFILDKGFLGLPPEGATPSSPESGELVASWEGMSVTLPGSVVRAWLYADGRIIWERRPWHNDPTAARPPEGANEFDSGYLEQRLTPEGVELVRSEVAELFDRSRTVLETVPVDPYPFGRRPGRLALVVFPESYLSAGIVEVPDGDHRVRLQWQELASIRANGGEGVVATPEQLAALRRVDALFSDPASVLPPDAWAVRQVRAYVPAHYAVCIEATPPTDTSHLLSLLPARAADLLRGNSRTRTGRDLIWGSDTENGPVSGTVRAVTDCYKVATEAARDVADALSGLEHEPGYGDYGLAYRVAEPVNNGEATWPTWNGEATFPTWLRIEAYLPDGQVPFLAGYG